MVCGVARVATLPVTIVARLFESDDVEEEMRELINGKPEVLDAIAMASPSLHGAVCKWLDGATSNARLRSRLLAYLLRMAWQTAPFGLFASIGAVSLGDDTSLVLNPNIGRVHRRPDVGAIDEFLNGLKQQDPPDELIVYPNPIAFRLGKRLIFSDASKLSRRESSLGPYFESVEASLNLTPLVEQLLASAKGGVAVATLLDGLLPNGLERQSARTVVSKLLRSGLLVSELNHPLVGDYASDIEQIIKRAFPDSLTEFQSCVRASLNTTTNATVVRHLDGSLGKPLRSEIERFVALHLALSTEVDISGYKATFNMFYEGGSRLVPLVKLLSNERGAGLRAPLKLERLNDPPRDSRRDTFLGEIASRALRDGSREVLLTDQEIALLINEHPPQVLPDSIEAGIEISAPSMTEVAKGNYLIALSPFGMRKRAGASIGRFLDVLPDDLKAKINAVHENRMEAEVLSHPPETRLKNVMCRGRIAKRYIACGVAPIPDTHSLSIEDIYVGLDDSGFYLWSEELQSRVEPVRNHLFNSGHFGPEIPRFLALIERGSRLDYLGLCSSNPLPVAFFPRMTYGRFVLARAWWRISDEILRDELRLSEFRERYSVPKIVTLVSGDHRLPIDLSRAIFRDLIEAELRKSQFPHLVFEELYPDLESTPLSDGCSKYSCELVLSATISKSTNEPILPSREIIATAGQRSSPPGSEWVYVQWACGQQADRLIRTRVEPLVKHLRENYGLRSWHFLRYVDNRTHLRLRFNPEKNHRAVLDDVINYSNAVHIAEDIAAFSVHTYERELERYGGLDALAVVERLFMRSSDAAIESIAKRVGVEVLSARLEDAVYSSQSIFVPADADFVEQFVSLIAPTRVNLDNEERKMLRRIRDRFTAANSSEKCSDMSALAALVTRSELLRIMNSVIHIHYNRHGLYQQHEMMGRTLQWHLMRSWLHANRSRSSTRSDFSVSPVRKSQHAV